MRRQMDGKRFPSPRAACRSGTSPSWSVATSTCRWSRSLPH